MAAWRNGIASDYDLVVESGDCRFDPCGGHFYVPIIQIVRKQLILEVHQMQL
jgi:hypothetical protein